MKKGYLVVEGHGEVKAAANLITRLWNDLKLQPLAWEKPIRGINLYQERGIKKSCELIRSKKDVSALVLLRDEDDECPKKMAPQIAEWVRQLGLPFPTCVVLAHCEFEVFFLPCMSIIAGKKIEDGGNGARLGILKGTIFKGNPESIRGVKEWLSEHMPAEIAYKPTLDQLPLTRMVDFQLLRNANPPVPCFGTLERALQFLDSEISKGGKRVYPPGLK